MTIYTVVDILTGILGAIMMFMLLETFCVKRENVPMWGYGLGIVALAVLFNFSNQVFQSGILNAVFMSASIFGVSFLYKGQIKVKAVISVLGFLFLGVIEIIVLFIITLVFGITVAEVVNNPANRLLGVIASKTITFVIVNVIRLKYKRNKIQIGSSYWALFFLMFANSIIAVFLIFKLSYEREATYMYNLSVLCSFGLLFSTIFALYLYEHLAQQAQIISEQQQFEQHLKSQIKHLDEILVTQKQIKTFRHDFSNQLIALTGYFRNHDHEGGLEYIKNLNDSFKMEEGPIETGNTALDAIVSSKKAIAESKNIRFTYQIQIPVKMNVDPIDICVIFGNALDNAIEACERVQETDRSITLTIIGKDASIFCKIVNSAVKQKIHLLKTSKTDQKNHGFGLQNIRTALEKYNSEPTIDYTDTEFTLKFVLFTKNP